MDGQHDSALERRFDQRMWRICERAQSECGYNAARFRTMLGQHGGFETAKLLLQGRSGPQWAAGLEAMWRCRRLDLTVEALALEAEFESLFSHDQRLTAQKRLSQLGYEPGA